MFLSNDHKQTDGYLLEACAGLIEQGESPGQAVIREAREETGYKISDPVQIGAVYTSAGGLTEYLAQPNDSLRIKYTSVFTTKRPTDFFGMTDPNLFVAKKSAQKIIKNVYNRLQIGVKAVAFLSSALSIFICCRRA